MIKIKTPDDRISTGYDVTVTDEKDNSVNHVCAINISIGPDQITTATIELCPVVDIGAIPEYFLLHPISGERKRIKSIEFFDGDVFKGE